MTLIVTWLWQGLAVAWITAAAVAVMPRLNAATRHAVWWLALAAVLAIPVAHGLAAITTATPSAAGLAAFDAADPLLLPAIPGGVMACAAAIWAMTAAVRLLRIATGCRALARMKRASLPFDRAREARLPLWVGARVSGHRPAELRTSDCITGACALGIGRAVILVSRSVADALSDESLDEIVMHEQAHLDRYDDWSQLLLAVVGSLVGLHPAVRFLERRLDVDREAACDDRVVSCTGAPRRYVCSLLAVAAASNPEPESFAFAAGAPAATTTVSALRVRVGRLLDPRRERGARLASATSLISITALAIAVVISTQMAPAVIFLDAAAVNAPAAAPAIESPRAPETAPATTVSAAVRGSKIPDALAPPSAAAALGWSAGRRAPEVVSANAGRGTREPPTQSDQPETAAHPFAEATPDPLPTAPLESRSLAADRHAPVPVLAVPLSANQLPALAPGPVPAAAPWGAVRSSAASAAGDVAHAAAEAGARARRTGVSIGRFVARAGKAGAAIF